VLAAALLSTLTGAFLLLLLARLLLATLLLLTRLLVGVVLVLIVLAHVISFQGFPSKLCSEVASHTNNVCVSQFVPMREHLAKTMEPSAAMRVPFAHETRTEENDDGTLSLALAGRCTAADPGADLGVRRPALNSGAARPPIFSKNRRASASGNGPPVSFGMHRRAGRV
jgi:hypothetical protein